MRLHFIRFVILFGILFVLATIVYNNIGNSLLKNEIESINFTYVEDEGLLRTQIVIFNPSSFMVPVRELELKVLQGEDIIYEEVLRNFRLALQDTTIIIRTPITNTENITVNGKLMVRIPLVDSQTLTFKEAYFE